MAIRKQGPNHSKLVDQKFSTKAAAEEWAKNDKAKNKQLGMTVRYDISLDPQSNQWVVKLDYYF